MKAICCRLSAAITAFAMLLVTCGSSSANVVRFEPVSRDVIQQRLEKFGGNDQQREASLKQLFADSGCDGEHLSEQAVRGSKLPNVICVLPGTSGETIVVGAHFDHVSAGDGVVDNWSGAALLPSLYEAVKNVPRKHTYIFIGFTDEEKGEVGSHFYVQQMTKTQVATTDAMVNLDTLGLGPTKVWTSHSDRQLTSELAYMAQKLKASLEGVNVEQVGSSDSEQFAARKIPRITIHSLTQETWNKRILHGPKDKLSVVRMDDYYQTYRLVSAFLAFLDQMSQPSSNSATSH